jgi:hypothetical protein
MLDIQVMTFIHTEFTILLVSFECFQLLSQIPGASLKRIQT